MLGVHRMIAMPYLPGDSICDLLIPKRWRALNLWKGQLTIQKKGHKVLPGRCFQSCLISLKGLLQKCFEGIWEMKTQVDVELKSRWWYQGFFNVYLIYFLHGLTPLTGLVFSLNLISQWPGFPCLQEPSAELRKKAANLLTQARRSLGCFWFGGEIVLFRFPDPFLFG